jgi:radical SAM protein with 4Fe4S-binding SPASM domain
MKHCFGTIFPDISNKTNNADATGKVFSLHVESVGTVHTHPQLKADLAEWEDCQKCEYFRSCYDFCTAKLSMQRMVNES